MTAGFWRWPNDLPTEMTGELGVRKLKVQTFLQAGEVKEMAVELTKMIYF